MSQLIASLVGQAKTKPKTREAMLELAPKPVYDDGRTKQCHRDSCDINRIMDRFQQTGTISHLAKYEGVYANFADFDFQAHQNKLAQGNSVFEDLPSELKQEFGQSPAKFFAYVNDPANAGKLREKLPALAKPGRQLPPVLNKTAEYQAAERRVSEPEASDTTTPTLPTEGGEKTAGDGS